MDEQRETKSWDFIEVKDIPESHLRNIMKMLGYNHMGTIEWMRNTLRLYIMTQAML